MEKKLSQMILDKKFSGEFKREARLIIFICVLLAGLITVIGK